MDDTNADAAERAMLRNVATGLPVATILAAAGVAIASSAAPAILVLTGGVLLGVIMLVWTSIRTLTGDAPLSPELVEAMTARRARETALAEKKRMTLLALKDLEHEHGVGKIDDEDYVELSAELRARAKEIMREMDLGLDPVRARAEEIVRTHLEKRGFREGERPTVQVADDERPTAPNKDAGARDSSGSDSDRATVPGLGKDGPRPPAAGALPGDEPVPASYVDAPKARGVELASDEVASSTVTTVAPARVFCPKCHASNEPDAAFCKACGAAVSRESKP